MSLSTSSYFIYSSISSLVNLLPSLTAVKIATVCCCLRFVSLAFNVSGLVTALASSPGSTPDRLLLLISSLVNLLPSLTAVKIATACCCVSLVTFNVSSLVTALASSTGSTPARLLSLISSSVNLLPSLTAVKISIACCCVRLVSLTFNVSSLVTTLASSPGYTPVRLL